MDILISINECGYLLMWCGHLESGEAKIEGGNISNSQMSIKHNDLSKLMYKKV